MEKRRRPIGLFDSGLGGISVLAEAVRLLPAEDFVYYGDTGHAPYGDKQPEEVLRLSRAVVDKLMARGSKAILIACNTATSAAAAALREEMSVPIIGMEPALKPAALMPGQGSILVLATRMTLKLPKFSGLMEHYGQDAVPIPGSGLVELVERGEMEGERVEALLREFLAPYLDRPVKAIVLGCTHYVFLRKAIRRVVGEEVPLVDGNAGTVSQLARKLQEGELQRLDAGPKGQVTFLTSAPKRREALGRMETIFNLALAQREG
ncbi:MAG: glutamate racemase [Candidatus Limiplasma sp.]|nr:glutamate racemase [Candidatus Limiplasma sp.]